MKEITIRSVRVGHWYSECCEVTLKQIKDEKELEEVRKEYIEQLEDYFEDGAGLLYQFWETKEDALSDYAKGIVI
jgi:hypothetical protein